ncbi:MAG: 30S ribosomal protein S8e [Nanoarchaeota archaeon]
MKYGRKITGGKYHKQSKKKKYALRGLENKVKLRETRKKIVRLTGGRERSVILSTNIASVNDVKTKKTKNVKIKNVVQTPSDHFLARQNILVKSAIIDTDLGKARITNRPSRDGNVQAVLIE